MSDVTATEEAEKKTAEGETTPEFVDVSTIEDPEKLREVMRDAGKFTEEQPAAETPVAPIKGDEEVKEDEAPPSRNRAKVKISHLNPAERAVIAAVSKGSSLAQAQQEVVTNLVRDGKSLAEAEAEVFGDGGRRSRVESQKETLVEAREDETPDLIAEKQKEIDQILTDLAAARAIYDVNAIEELRDKRDDAREVMRDLKAAKQSTTQTAAERVETAFVDAVTVSTNEAIALFPDAEKEGTELFEAIQDAVEDRKESDPDFFKNKNWPKNLAAEIAAELGIPSTKHKGGAMSPQGEQKTAVQPKKAARPLVPASGASGGQANQTTGELTPEAELTEAGDDVVKLRAWTRKHGTRSLPVGLAA